MMIKASDRGRGGGGAQHITHSPPSKKSKETNWVSLVAQQEQELFNSKVSRLKREAFIELDSVRI